MIVKLHHFKTQNIKVTGHDNDNPPFNPERAGTELSLDQ